MYISINWIKDFVDLDGVDVEKLIYKFTMSTAEVEGITKHGQDVDGVIVAKVLSVANVVFKAPSMSSEKVAKYGIDKALKGKLIIIPGILNKSVRFFSKILPDAILEEASYHIQRRKR